MLNAKYDRKVNDEQEALPLYDLLSTPKNHKRLIACDADHQVPGNECIRESSLWPDEYFGPASRK